MTLATINPTTLFCALAHASHVKLEGDAVTGRINSQPSRIYGSANARLVENLVNWPDASESIVLFVKRYGPFIHLPQLGKEFRYPLSAWKSCREKFRDLWRNI